MQQLKKKLHFNCFRAEPLDLFVVTLLLINKICESSAQCDAVHCATKSTAEFNGVHVGSGSGWDGGSFFLPLGLGVGLEGVCCEMAAQAQDQVASERKRARDKGFGAWANTNRVTKTIVKIEEIS